MRKGFDSLAAQDTRSKRDRPRAARAIPAARGNGALSKNALLIIAMARGMAAGDRWFESISLQRGVKCELDPMASAWGTIY
jgi:transcription elongation GreA/GreB family factor